MSELEVIADFSDVVTSGIAGKCTRFLPDILSNIANYLKGSGCDVNVFNPSDLAELLRKQG